MINEEISNRVVNIEVNVLKATYQEILSQVKKLQQRSKRLSQMKIKKKY